MVIFAIVIFTMEGLFMKTIKTKLFTKWANKNKVSDESLICAAKEIAADNYEANYGGGVIKKRIANKGRGKRGSARSIVAFKSGKTCFFIYGFEKSAKSNIATNEEKAMKILAKSLFAYSDESIKRLINEGSLIEVSNE
ncbi:MAG: type II toxin-antitoxin system RelE/ParE family toxin [Legionellaceae bacterium]|nr:type II toxin-antitoxin system RelE/ParE family toxin [Legionellaceae bacterium]